MAAAEGWTDRVPAIRFASGAVDGAHHRGSSRKASPSRFPPRSRLRVARANPDRTSGRRRVDDPAPLDDLNATVGNEATSGLPSRLHQLPPVVVASDAAGSLTRTDRRPSGSAGQETKDFPLQILVRRTWPGRAAAGRAVADVIPVSGPLATPHDESSAGAAGLRRVICPGRVSLHVTIPDRIPRFTRGGRRRGVRDHGLTGRTDLSAVAANAVAGPREPVRVPLAALPRRPLSGLRRRRRQPSSSTSGSGSRGCSDAACAPDPCDPDCPAAPRSAVEPRRRPDVSSRSAGTVHR